MHVRRLTMLITGAWLGLTLAMLFVATENFRGVDRMIAGPSPEASRSMENVPAAERRMLFRYLASELNRYFFDWYGIAQICLAALLLLNLLFATNGNKWMMGISLAILALVVLERTVLFPEITYLGRLLDFVPAEVSNPARGRFWSFHNYFSVFEVVKILLLLFVSARMLVQRDIRRAAPDVRTEKRRYVKG